MLIEYTVLGPAKETVSKAPRFPIIVNEWEDVPPCSECDGSGLWAAACWDSPSIPCDECNGSGLESEVEL